MNSKTFLFKNTLEAEVCDTLKQEINFAYQLISLKVKTYILNEFIDLFSVVHAYCLLNMFASKYCVVSVQRQLTYYFVNSQWTVICLYTA